MKSELGMRKDYEDAVMRAVVDSAADAVANNDLFGKSAEIFVQEAALRAARNVAYLITGTNFTVAQCRRMCGMLAEACEKRSKAV